MPRAKFIRDENQPLDALREPQTPGREADELRLADLADYHRLPYRRDRSTYVFEGFTAHGLRQALGYVEGYDRAMSAQAKCPSPEDRPDPFRTYYFVVQTLLDDGRWANTKRPDPKEAERRRWLKRRIVQTARQLAAQGEDELGDGQALDAQAQEA